MRMYQPPSKGRMSKKDEEMEISDFRTKWAQYVTNDLPETNDLMPMLGLDAYGAISKPFRIFSHYDSNASWR